MSAKQQKYRSVLVIDDHNMVVNGIKLLIGGQFQDFYHANNAKAGIELAMKHKPQLAIIDYVLPDQPGDTVVREVRYHCTDCQILGYSFNMNSVAVLKMFSAGINGYVVKGEDDDEFTRAVTYLLEGTGYFCKEARTHIINRLSMDDNQMKLIVANTGFTAKEIEIIRLSCKQKTARQISRLVFLSERTVEQYRSNIIKRIGAKNIAGIIKFALQQGIIELEDL
jgi:DNA-binding NarL/FixJ family response regulator